MSFNHNNGAYNTKAAKIIVPILQKEFNPASVLDVGCGIGTWLSIFKMNGVDDIYGIDGDYVDRELLKKHIDESIFYPFDLKKELNLKRKFDLVISLEVAEHIDETYADSFIKTLVNHSNIIVFSAAIPLQIGENHVNEQWMSYWASMFQKHNYYVHDIIRPEIWNDKRIEYWYRQNMVVFKKGEESNVKILDIVLPDFYLLRIGSLEKRIQSFENGSMGFKYYFKMTLIAFKSKILRLWKIYKPM